ncbi:MAG TPA: response regulator transcription factor, partial [Verrucomicrobiae bacterium]|nr:response regulator transcription factor [Verrucomicrobiae bacterium]
MNKTVVIVEDDDGLREQLLKIIGKAPDVKCIGAYASAEEAIRGIQKATPELVLMDIKLPCMSGIQCVAELKKIAPAVQIIMVTVYEDSERIFRALKAGAIGYLVKSSPPSEILAAIRDVSKGASPMSTPIARKIVQHFHSLGASAQQEETLSAREHEVLELLSKGFIYKEIGEQLNIESETVRSHVKNICQKMHVRGRVEAVAKHNR